MQKLILTVTSLLISVSVFAVPPQRIVSGIPAATEMLFALELDERIVGVTTNCNYPPAAKKIEKVGGFFLNLEKIVALKPDLVVLQEDAQKREIQKFRDFGLPVFTIKPENIEGVIKEVLRLGEKAERAEKAKEVVAVMRRRLERYAPKAFSLDFILRRPRVLLIVGDKPLVVAGGGTFLDDVIKYSGGENIAAGARAAYPQFSFEKLLDANPDYLIIPNGVISRADFVRDRRWLELQAVNSDQVIFVDPDILSRPGPRIVEAVETIAKRLRRP